jgi:hypothetical protein
MADFFEEFPAYYWRVMRKSGVKIKKFRKVGIQPDL